MKSSIKFQVFGIKNTLKYLEFKKYNTINKTKSGIRDATIFVKDEVKQSIDGKRGEIRSVDTGELRNSVEDEYTQFAGIVQTKVPHGKFIEYGTSRIPERRHFRNSANRNKIKIKNLIQRKVNTI